MITTKYKVVVSNYFNRSDEFYQWVDEHGGSISHISGFGFTTVFLTEEQYILYLLKWE